MQTSNSGNNVPLLFFYKESFCNQSIWLSNFVNGCNKTFKLGMKKDQKNHQSHYNFGTESCNVDVFEDLESNVQYWYVLFL